MNKHDARVKDRWRVRGEKLLKWKKGAEIYTGSWFRAGVSQSTHKSDALAYIFSVMVQCSRLF